MVMESLKKGGNRFFFEYFLEVWKPKLIEKLRHWLSHYSTEDIRKMVTGEHFPDTQKLDLSSVAEYVQYIENIPLDRLLEDFLAPARPDLIEALQEMGMSGAMWLARLRLHILSEIRQSAKTEPAIPKEDIAMATCDICGKSWPVARSEFEGIKACPFCGGDKEKPVSPLDN